MSHQPEQVLEDNLVKQLQQLGYSRVIIKNEDDLLANLQKQLEKHNNMTFSKAEFAQLLNHLQKGTIFEKAKIVRDKMSLLRDDGSKEYIEFLNTSQWCQNEYQVTHQVTIEGVYKNRYDVTLLVNGLPLVQIELKRRGLELKEAFNQIQRYQKHSFGANSKLYNYIQIFLISNGVNTKYYANNKKQSFKQTFFWADESNETVRELESFASEFLEACHLSKMICRYIVLAEVDKVLMVLRPYQYYAVENIISTVEESAKNGYIWHTTGSGKTLTSFKASQILIASPKVKKVIFVVDRKDLDYQTTKEFNSFSAGSVDGTDNTKILVNQLLGKHHNSKGELLETDLIITTIQKLNSAISKERYLTQMEQLKQEPIVFIFDECHRSQFGETHNRIKNFFENYQMFGFTGTPIFAQNAVKNALGTRTTAELFDKCLHKYVITDAIRDENVLKFSIEYMSGYRAKESTQNQADIKVENIDTKELLESPQRVKQIVEYILAHHDRKTHSRNFTAMMCVSSVEMLIHYYELFNSKEHSLRIATIFSYSANEEDKGADGLLDDDIHIDEKHINPHSREKLDEYIQEYNQTFGTKYSTKDSNSFYNYYRDIANRVKKREIDILIVVNMFLTGFDSKTLNTLYVDKNLKYHGLIQAFSRTNRILNEQKSQGNIVCFRNLKEATDDAIQLFSNKDAKELILIASYEEYCHSFNQRYQEMIELTPTVESVTLLGNEEEELAFIKAFRELMRLKNILTSFSDFCFGDLEMGEQEFEDYKSKYLDLYDKVKSNRAEERVSILADVDFELELIHKDEITVTYILKLLAQLGSVEEQEEREKLQKSNIDLLEAEASLRSKRELIEKFIQEQLPHIKSSDEIDEKFSEFWREEQNSAFENLCKEEGLEPIKLQSIIDEYLYTQRKPLGDEIINIIEERPKLLYRKKIIVKITDKILDFVKCYLEE